MTLQDLLHIQLYGEENLREQEAQKEVASCIDEEYDFFVGTKRAESVLESIDKELPYVSGINKAIMFFKVNENRVLKEEKMTQNGVRILLHDALKGLEESVHILESNRHGYNTADKRELAKIYASLLFEAQLIGDEYNITVDDLMFKNDEMRQFVAEDFRYIAREVF